MRYFLFVFVFAFTVGFCLSQQEGEKKQKPRDNADFRGERDLQGVSAPGEDEPSKKARRKAEKKRLKKVGRDVKKKEKTEKKQAKTRRDFKGDKGVQQELSRPRDNSDFRGERDLQRISAPGDDKPSKKARRKAEKKRLKEVGVDIKEKEKTERKQAKTRRDFKGDKGVQQELFRPRDNSGFKGERDLQRVSAPGDDKPSKKARRKAEKARLKEVGVDIKEKEKAQKKQAKVRGEFKGDKDVQQELFRPRDNSEFKGAREVQRVSVPGDDRKRRRARRRAEKAHLKEVGVDVKGKEKAERKQAKVRREFQGEKGVQQKLFRPRDNSGYEGSREVQVVLDEKYARRPEKELMTEKEKKGYSKQGPVRKLKVHRERRRWVTGFGLLVYRVRSFFFRRTVIPAQRPLRNPKGLKYDKDEREIWFD